MKKTLIALAALAATGAFAQSLTLTGGIDVGVNNTTQSTGGTKAVVLNNNTYTSQIDIVGSEDLGGGLKANVFLELDFNATTSNSTDGSTSSSSSYFTGTPFNGQQYVGISGGFGEVQLGTPNAAALNNNGQIQPFGTAMGSGYSGGFGRLSTNALSVNQYVGAGGTSNGRIIRHEKVAKYITPTFAGLQGSLEYAFLSQTDGAGTNATQNNRVQESYSALGLNYVSGPVTVVYSYTRVASTPAGSQFNIMATAASTSALAADSSAVFQQLGGNVKFGPATVYAGYTKTKTDNQDATLGLAEDGNSWNVAAKYAVAPAIDVMANYLVRNSNLANNAKLFGAGVDYKLSKRTNLYYRYEAIDTNTDGKTATAGSSATIGSAVGIKHMF